MKWQNIQFGEFEYQEDHILNFPEGLFGFEDLHKFVLINDEQSEPIRWLVSLEDGYVSFPVIEPHIIVPTYTAGEYDTEGNTILVVVTLRSSVEESTVNLRSPIVISNTTQEGRQVVLMNEEYSFEYPLFHHEADIQKG
ncbi:MAG: flagellar assembly protein FliW [Bacteroidetes bacterium]|nr:flagellar assembly protein FliW [Bacteroidota bacterium]